MLLIPDKEIIRIILEQYATYLARPDDVTQKIRHDPIELRNAAIYGKQVDEERHDYNLWLLEQGGYLTRYDIGFVITIKGYDYFKAMSAASTDGERD
jgi:hypothetical protein